MDRHHKKSNNGGFTMLEFILVLGLISILSAASLMLVSDSFDEQRRVEARLDVQIILASVRSYSDAKGSLPPDLGTLQSSGYITRGGVDFSHIGYSVPGKYVAVYSSVLSDTWFVVPARLTS